MDKTTAFAWNTYIDSCFHVVSTYYNMNAVYSFKLYRPDNTWRANQIYSATHLFDIGKKYIIPNNYTIEAKGCSSNERNALIDFYYSMNGEAW